MEDKSQWTDRDYEQYREYEADNYEAHRKAMKKVMFEAHYNDIKARLDTGQTPQGVYETFCFKKVQKLVKDTRNYAMIGYAWLTFTINKANFSSSDEYLPRLQRQVAKANTKKWISRSMWNFELTEQGVPHVHYLFQFSQINTIRKDKFVKGFCSTFEKVGYVDIKKIPDDWVKDKVDYLKGIKWDEDKLPMVLADRAWRAEQGLQDVYVHGDWADHLLDGSAQSPASSEVHSDAVLA